MANIYGFVQKNVALFLQLQVFSKVLLAICDANLNLLYVDIGAYGKSDSFSKSQYSPRNCDNGLHIPKDGALCGFNTSAPFVYVGDGCFAYSKNVL